MWFGFVRAVNAVWIISRSPLVKKILDILDWYVVYKTLLFFLRKKTLLFEFNYHIIWFRLFSPDYLDVNFSFLIVNKFIFKVKVRMQIIVKYSMMILIVSNYAVCIANKLFLVLEALKRQTCAVSARAALYSVQNATQSRGQKELSFLDIPCIDLLSSLYFSNSFSFLSILSSSFRA